MFIILYFWDCQSLVWAMKNPGGLGYIREYTTQLCPDHKKPLLYKDPY